MHAMGFRPKPVLRHRSLSQGRVTLRAFAILFALAMCALGQSDMRSTETLSAGLAHNVGSTCCGESAPSLAASYAYRILPHLDLEAGVDATTLLGTEIRGANYDIKPNDRFTWVPFGLKGVLPLRHGRA